MLKIVQTFAPAPPTGLYSPVAVKNVRSWKIVPISHNSSSINDTISCSVFLNYLCTVFYALIYYSAPKDILIKS